METLKFQFHDGGRLQAGYKGQTRDCVARAIAIATELPYQQVYDMINEFALTEKTGKRKTSVSNARKGVYKDTTRKIMSSLGWEWIPTMQIGQGCKVHLRADELPSGRIIVKVSKHCVAVIDHTLYDTYDCTREGDRCVYGYYQKKA
jgi:hypothetical protein